MSGALFWVGLAYAALLGAVVGSFLNVVIARLPEGESIVSPRSRCPRCKTPIAWYDNVPLVSFVILRGKCRRCALPISPRYVVVEALVALLFAALWLRVGLSWQLALWLPLFAALVAIIFLDLDHWWVPDVITFPAMLLALAAALLPDGIGLVSSLLGLLPALLLWGFAFLFGLILRKEAMGLGDIKLLAMLGLALGALPTLILLFLAAVQGSVVGVLVVMTGGHKDARARAIARGEAQPESQFDDDWVPPPRAIPFGPFLALACFEVVLWPELFLDEPLRLIELMQQLTAV